jgi:hypothetical protein
MGAMNIYKEMWKAAEKIEALEDGGYYPNTDKVLQGLNHQLAQLDFFYNKLVPGQGGDANKTYYNISPRPKEHQLIYVNLNRGYPKEIFDVHYCYVVKDFGAKFIVIPTTSIKPTTSVNDAYEMMIEEADGTPCLLNFDEIKAIDPMRIAKGKPYRDVKTPRKDIVGKFSEIFIK